MFAMPANTHPTRVQEYLATDFELADDQGVLLQWYLGRSNDAGLKSTCLLEVSSVSHSKVDTVVVATGAQRVNCGILIRPIIYFCNKLSY